MRFKIGNKVLVKKEVASQVSFIKNMIKSGATTIIGEIKDIDLKNHVLCTICGFNHKPMLFVLIKCDYEDNDIWLTPCEMSPLLKEKIDKIINL